MIFRSFENVSTTSIRTRHASRMTRDSRMQTMDDQSTPIDNDATSKEKSSITRETRKLLIRYLRRLFGFFRPRLFHRCVKTNDDVEMNSTAAERTKNDDRIEESAMTECSIATICVEREWSIDGKMIDIDKRKHHRRCLWRSARSQTEHSRWTDHPSVELVKIRSISPSEKS